VALLPEAQNTNWDIWIGDVARGTLTPLTFAGVNYAPVWSADGKRVVFRNTVNGRTGIFWAPADGSGQPERLLATDGPTTPTSFARDSSVLLFYQGRSHPIGIWVLPLPGAGGAEQKAHLLFQPLPSVNNIRPQLSPDGKWVAYDSTESGVPQIYVRPYPGPGEKIPISTEGGHSARWSRDGRELFYRNGDRLIAVDVMTAPDFRVGTPKTLFDWPQDATSTSMQPGTGYDVSLDGKRFLMVQRTGENPGPTQLQVVQDWFEELKQRVPVRR
jgi:Tol biopolymer transport system component